MKQQKDEPRDLFESYEPADDWRDRRLEGVLSFRELDRRRPDPETTEHLHELGRKLGVAEANLDRVRGAAYLLSLGYSYPFISEFVGLSHEVVRQLHEAMTPGVRLCVRDTLVWKLSVDMRRTLFLKALKAATVVGEGEGADARYVLATVLQGMDKLSRTAAKLGRLEPW